MLFLKAVQISTVVSFSVFGTCLSVTWPCCLVVKNHTVFSNSFRMWLPPKPELRNRRWSLSHPSAWGCEIREVPSFACFTSKENTVQALTPPRLLRYVCDELLTEWKNVFVVPFMHYVGLCSELWRYFFFCYFLLRLWRGNKMQMKWTEAKTDWPFFAGIHYVNVVGQVS